MLDDEDSLNLKNRGIKWEDDEFIHQCTLKSQPFDELFRNRSKLLRKTTISKSYPLTKQYFSSLLMIEKAINGHINGPHWYIIHPLSEFVLIWDRTMLIVYILNWYVVLFQIANYGYLTSTSTIINVILQFPCYVDIVLRFFTGLRNKYDIFLDPQIIILNYLKTTFLPDLIASIPFQIVVHLLANHVSKLTLYFVIIYQTLKIFTFNRIKKYFRECFNVWVYHYAMYMVLSLVLYSMLFFHVASCFYQIEANLIGIERPINSHSLNNLQHVDQFPKLGIFWYRNLYCMYLMALKVYCFTFVYRLDENVTSLLDMLFSSWIIIGAYIFHTYVIVKVIGIFQFQHSSKIKYQEIINQLEQYMRTKRLPLAIRKSLIEFYQQRYQFRFFKEKSIEENLSESLRRELIFHCGKLFIKNIGIFENISKKSLFKIVACLKPEIYMPNDLVTKAGAIGDCMYFIASGTIAVRATTGQELLHLEDGDHFGEVALFSKHGKRVSNTIAIEYCELYRLDKNDYEKYIATIPELADKFQNLAMQRMNATNSIVESFKIEQHKKYTIDNTEDDDDDSRSELDTLSATSSESHK